MRHLYKYILALATFIVACTDPYMDSTYQVYDINPASTYLDSRADEFSEWIEILKFADLYNGINQASESFTVFVPINDAVKRFYDRKEVNSIHDLGREYARDLAAYHIIPDSISLEDFIAGGRLANRTLSDDYLNVTFDETSEEGGFNSVYINHEARVNELAIPVSNGSIYVLNEVLSPLVESVNEKIEEFDDFSLFSAVLDYTGLADTLDIIYEEHRQADGVVRRQKRDFTVLAVSDQVFAQNGISSIEDLIDTLGADEFYTESDNELYRYAAYHIINGRYSLIDLYKFDRGDNQKLWNTSANTVLEISKTEGNEYFLNYGSERYRAQFVDNLSDVPAKNGLIHQLDGFLPIWFSETPVEVLFDLCNYPDIASYIEANGKEGQVYQQVHPSSEFQTDISHLPIFDVNIINEPATPTSSFYNVGYFTVRQNNDWRDCMYGDQMILNLGYLGSVEMETPILIKGKYKVSLRFCYATSMNFMRTLSGGSNGGKLQFSFDGDHVTEFAPYATVADNKLGSYDYEVYDEIEFDETGSHKFKIVVMDPAAGTNSSFRVLLDYVLFEPIIEE